MKITPLFKVEKNTLIRISNSEKIDMQNTHFIFASDILNGKVSVPTPSDTSEKTPIGIKISYSEVDLGQGAYNEELLASLRDFLKSLEESGFCAFIIPSCEKSLESADDADSFIKAMVHTARRIKDCENVCGFAIAQVLLEKDAPSNSIGENSYTRWFIDEMCVKHSHYIFFADEKTLESLSLKDEAAKNEFVFY